MSFALTLIFTCGVGCGEPPSVTIDQVYSSYEECDQSGQGWLSPDANPQATVLTYSCDQSSAEVLATSTGQTANSPPAAQSNPAGGSSGGGFFDELLNFFKKLFRA